MDIARVAIKWKCFRIDACNFRSQTHARESLVAWWCRNINGWWWRNRQLFLVSLWVPPYPPTVQQPSLGPLKITMYVCTTTTFSKILSKKNYRWRQGWDVKSLVYTIHGLSAEGVGAVRGSGGGCEGGSGGDERHSRWEFILRNSPPPEMRWDEMG